MAEQQALKPDSWMAFDARLRGYVRRRVDPASVDDVVGAILLRLVQRQDDLKKARNPIAWAMRVAANAVIDHHRRRASERGALARVAEDAASRPGAAENDEADAGEELANCLVPLIHSLPESYAEALMLTDIEGLTQRDAAERLGLSLSGVKSRVQRGRGKLKQALLRCCQVQLDSRGGILDYRRRSEDSCGRC